MLYYRLAKEYRLENVRGDIAFRLRESRRNRWTARGLALFLAWGAFLATLVGPRSGLPMLPDSVGLGDIFWVMAMSVGLVLLAENPRFPRIGGHFVWGSFCLYLALILVLPIIGLIIFPNAELAWYLGDLRWLQVLSIAFLFFWCYQHRPYTDFYRHCIHFLGLLALVNFLVLVAQVKMQALGGGAPLILELWYPEGESGYGRYGIHISRFAGAMNEASGLATIGGVCLLVSALSRPLDWKSGMIGFLGLIFVLASGSRSMIFGLGVAIPTVILASVVLDGRIRRISPTTAILISALVGLIGWGAARLNLGRIMSSARLEQTFAWLSGQTTFEAISGRGGARWSQPLIASQEWSPLGTLVNPSHALSHLSAFDSYYVFLGAQAGPILLILFAVLMILLATYAVAIWLKNRNSGAVSLGIVVTLLLSSITQNLMTGMAGRVLLTVAIVNVIIYLTVQQRKYFLFTDSKMQLFQRSEIGPSVPKR